MSAAVHSPTDSETLQAHEAWKEGASKTPLLENPLMSSHHHYNPDQIMENEEKAPAQQMTAENFTGQDLSNRLPTMMLFHPSVPSEAGNPTIDPKNQNQIFSPKHPASEINSRIRNDKGLLRSHKKGSESLSGQFKLGSRVGKQTSSSRPEEIFNEKSSDLAAWSNLHTFSSALPLPPPPPSSIASRAKHPPPPGKPNSSSVTSSLKNLPLQPIGNEAKTREGTFAQNTFNQSVDGQSPALSYRTSEKLQEHLQDFLTGEYNANDANRKQLFEKIEHKIGSIPDLMRSNKNLKATTVNEVQDQDEIKRISGLSAEEIAFAIDPASRSTPLAGHMVPPSTYYPSSLGSPRSSEIVAFDGSIRGSVASSKASTDPDLAVRAIREGLGWLPAKILDEMNKETLKALVMKAIEDSELEGYKDHIKRQSQHILQSDQQQKYYNSQSLSATNGSDQDTVRGAERTTGEQNLTDQAKNFDSMSSHQWFEQYGGGTLPSGWNAEYDYDQQAWYYINNNTTPPFTTWEDPLMMETVNAFTTEQYPKQMPSPSFFGGEQQQQQQQYFDISQEQQRFSGGFVYPNQNPSYMPNMPNFGQPPMDPRMMQGMPSNYFNDPNAMRAYADWYSNAYTKAFMQIQQEQEDQEGDPGDGPVSAEIKNEKKRVRRFKRAQALIDEATRRIQEALTGSPSEHNANERRAAEVDLARARGMMDSLRMQDEARKAVVPAWLNGYSGPIRGYEYPGDRQRTHYVDATSKKWPTQPTNGFLPDQRAFNGGFPQMPQPIFQNSPVPVVQLAFTPPPMPGSFNPSPIGSSNGNNASSERIETEKFRKIDDKDFGDQSKFISPYKGSSIPTPYGMPENLFAWDMFLRSTLSTERLAQRPNPPTTNQRLNFLTKPFIKPSQQLQQQQQQNMMMMMQSGNPLNPTQMQQNPFIPPNQHPPQNQQFMMPPPQMGGGPF